MGRQPWMMVGKKHLTDYHASIASKTHFVIPGRSVISYATQITIQNDKMMKIPNISSDWVSIQRHYWVLLQDVDEA